MAYETYLYSGINSYICELLISEIENVKDSSIVIRMNTPGGSVLPAWGLAAKMRETESKITIKVDGAALSMGANLCLFADHVECLDVTQFMLHRAAIDAPIDPQVQQQLNKINEDLKALYYSKLDNAKLIELKKVSIEDIFDPTQRIDVWLTAEEAKAIKLVNKINDLTVAKADAEAFYSMVAMANSKTATNNNKPIISNQNNKKMTIQEIKANHIDLYNEIVASAIKNEKDRVGSWLVFVDADSKLVTDNIKSGAEMNQTLMAELTRKTLSKETLASMASASAAPVVTEEEKIVAEKAKLEIEAQKTLDDFYAEAKKYFV